MNDLIPENRRKLLEKVHSTHNRFVGLLAFIVFLSFCAVQYSTLANHVSIFRTVFNSIVILDGSLILFFVFLLAKSSAERAILVDLNKPLLMLCFGMIFIIPILNVFREEPFLPPWSPSVLILLLLPLAFLEVGRQGYWALDEDGRVPSEGERIRELLTFLTVGASIVSFILICLWLRVIYSIGLASIRHELLVIMILQLPVFLTAWVIDIRYNWMEHTYSDKACVLVIILASISAIATSMALARVADWYVFHAEVMLLFMIYIDLLFPAVCVLQRYTSKVALFGVLFGNIPGIMYLIAMFANDNGVVKLVLSFLLEHKMLIQSGTAWVLGAFAGSSLFSLCLWIAQRRSGNSQTSNINNAPVEEIAAIPGISNRLAEDIHSAKPYSSLNDIAERVSGVGIKRLEELQKAYHAEV